VSGPLLARNYLHATQHRPLLRGATQSHAVSDETLIAKSARGGRADSSAPRNKRSTRHMRAPQLQRPRSLGPRDDMASSRASPLVLIRCCDERAFAPLLGMQR
jgi:hypothetical protein